MQEVQRDLGNAMRTGNNAPMNDSTPKRHAVLLQRLLLAVLIPLALFAAIEWLLRINKAIYPTAFLVHRTIQDEIKMTDNPYFGYRFFPRAMTRMTVPLAIDPLKLGDTRRIFVLGGSAAMGEPLPDQGLAPLLQVMLQSACPNQRVEVYNAAMTAINSHIVREIAHDLQVADPDVLVLMMGNNEVVGPYGPGTVLSEPRFARDFPRLRVLASRLRLGSLIRILVQSTQPSAETSWQGMEMFQRAVPQTAPELNVVYRHFKANLYAILNHAHKHGTAVILLTVPVNLSDCPPFRDGPQLPDGSPAMAQRLHWRNRGRKLFEHHRLDEALKAYIEADRCLPDTATAQWDIARVYSAMGKHDKALSHYQQARDLDALRFRADSTINQVIREVAQATNVSCYYLDAESLFNQPLQLMRHQHLFVDHVHFSFEGNILLADALASVITDLPGFQCLEHTLTAKDAARGLVRTPWRDRDLCDTVIARLKREPFKSQAGITNRLQRWFRLRQETLTRQAQENPETVKEQYRTAIHQATGAMQPLQAYADWLFDIGAYANAELAFTRLVQQYPHRSDLRGSLGLVQALRGQPADGVATITAEAHDRHTHFPAHVLRKNAAILRQQQQYEAAHQFLLAAQRLEKHHPETMLQRALTEQALGHQEQANRIFKELLKEHPGQVDGLEEYALFLCQNGQPNAGESLFCKLLADYPQRASIREKYATWLIRQHRHQEALLLLQQAAHQAPLDPGPHALSALLYLKIGRETNAVESLRQARLRDPFDPGLRALEQKLAVDETSR
jgi:tetratricopeptide (TPR) repeat protein